MKSCEPSYSTPVNLWEPLRRLRDWLPNPPSTNFVWRKPPSPYDFLPQNPVIYDIGSKSAQATYFGALPANAQVICIDIEPGPGVDVVADAQSMPQLATASADCVFFVDVLPAVSSPEAAIAEIHRVLRPGGIVYVHSPFIRAYAEDPQDLYRFSVRGLELLCSDFERLAAGSNRGPASTVCDILVRFCAMLFCLNNHRLYTANVYIMKFALFWIKYIDVLIGHYSVAQILWGSPFFLGRKPLP